MIVITRKIQLLINADDPEFVKQCRATLYRWQNITYRAANIIMSHHFIQETVKDFFYLTEEVKYKLADQKKDEHGIFNRSRTNTTYRLLSDHFKGEIPTNILATLNHSLISSFNKEKSAYWSGERSLRNYKRNIPLPFGGIELRKLAHTPDGKDFTFNLFKIPFRTYLGKDRVDKRHLLERIMRGTMKLCASSIKIEKGKFYLLATVQIEKQEDKDLDISVIAEASLSFEYPIALKIGTHTCTIGNKEEFLHQRLAIQAARRRVQKAANYNRPGHGRKRKLQCHANYEQKERQYIDNKLHVYSKELVNQCLKYHAATLILVGQEEKEEMAQEDGFILKNWSYGNLRDKIAYKADRFGINLIIE